MKFLPTFPNSTPPKQHSACDLASKPVRGENEFEAAGQSNAKDFFRRVGRLVVGRKSTCCTEVLKEREKRKSPTPSFKPKSSIVTEFLPKKLLG